MHRISRSLIAAILLALVAGCAGTAQSTAAIDRSMFPIKLPKTIAVLPFENHAQAPNAGRIVADMFTTELTAKSGLAVMEPSVVWTRMSGLKDVVDAQEAVEKYSVTSLGTLVGADLVFAGTVTEYRYKKDGDEPSVGFTVRLVDVRSGKVMWTQNTTASGGLLGAGGIGSLSHKMVTESVAELVTFIGPSHTGKR